MSLQNEAGYFFTFTKEILDDIMPLLDTIVPVETVVPADIVTPVETVAAPQEVPEYRPYTPDRVLRKEKNPLYVYFEVGGVRLLRSFSDHGRQRDNGPVLDEIMDLTAQMLSDTTSSAKHIQIVGLASVEGRTEDNQRLSDERALALQRNIQERHPIPDSMFETVGGGEAWSEFRDQLQDLRYSVYLQIYYE